ncbi:serine/threonine-protein kinase [Roseateles oligotrophus]|uniref:Protein kinase n=1 Tax=Roseateles oligotrophus TaxID=1769250 RepID=A0ABT2YG54_9BURK|nr:serine/threonine-protein kinase [Roseateles oligotrophus]MCV2369041.1 protein kinase [Roseateles oligotrophus]
MPSVSSIAAAAASASSSNSAASSAGESGNALPIGTYVGEFELTGVLGEGGFGIVYLAWDHSLERKVALKEYMPSALSARVGNTQVQVKSARHRDTFEAGLKSFVNEAKLLASFDHPSLVKVYRFWEANGTAYMVMPFYEGITLKDKLREMGAPPDEQWLMTLLAPLTEALAVIHSASCFHRDIAPDNVILLGQSQKPLLLDFGAARRVIGDMTQALTVILKPGYAPVEQYAEAPNMKQGAWTDVYALAASVHFAIMGRTPPTSVGRLMSDSYVPLEQSAAGRYSQRFLQAIDRALRVRPEDRTASIAEMRIELGLGEAANAEALRPQSRFDASAHEATQFGSPAVHVLAQSSVPRAAQAEPEKGGSKGLWVGLGFVLLAAAGGAYMFNSPSKPIVTPPGAKESAKLAAPELAPTTALVAAAPASWDAREEFEKIIQGQTAGFAVEAVSSKPQFQIEKDFLGFSVKSARDGFINVLMLEQDGSLSLIFPSPQAPNNRIKGGQTLALPQRSWALKPAEPPGPQRFLVIVSAHPRDYSQLSKERDEMLLKLPTGETAAALALALNIAAKANGNAASSLLLGSSGNCTASDCGDYGAAQFGVEIVR